jgi:hypothetical protein
VVCLIFARANDSFLISLTVGFFVAFLSWFAFPPLLAESIKVDLQLTPAQIGNSNVSRRQKTFASFDVERLVRAEENDTDFDSVLTSDCCSVCHSHCSSVCWSTR